MSAQERSDGPDGATVARRPARRNRVINRRTVENEAFDGFARRILAAYGRRIAAGDVEALRSLVDLQRQVETMTGECVRALVEEQGYSWREVARPLGMPVGNAHRKYADRRAS